MLESEVVGNRQEMLPFEEAERLEVLEGVIRDNFQTWLKVGEALAEIRAKRLYRATHRSFDAYCRDRWNTSRQAASLMIRGLDVIDDLSRRLDSPEPAGPLPDNPWQAQPLIRLAPEKRREAWDLAVKDADGKAPSHNQVYAAAARVAPARPKVAPDDTQESDDVALGRADGTITAEAAVIILDEPGEEPEAATTPEESSAPADGAELSDEAWLDTLPARRELTTKARNWFDAEALAFRRVAQIRREFRDRSSRHTRQAKHEGRHVGPWLSLHDYYLRQADPSRWLACRTCKGSGHLKGVGRCPDCRGHAYHLGGDTVTDLQDEAPTSGLLSFLRDTAEKTNLTHKEIRQAVEIGQNLSDEAKAVIRGTPLANCERDLLSIARLPQVEQRQAAERILAGAKAPRPLKASRAARTSTSARG